jgi:membrane protein
MREAEVGVLAAAIAYYGFVSVLPTLLFVIAVASVVGGEALVESVLSATDEFLTASGREALEASLTSARGRSGATLVGLALLGWSTLRMFRGLDVAFSRVYGTRPADSFLGRTRDAAVVLLTVGLGLWAMIVGGGVLATLVPAGGDVLGLLVLLVGLSLIFLPLYYFLPDADLGLREVLPGTVLAALGWVVLQAGFQVYAANTAQFSLYGVIGGILLLVTWFYAAATLLLVGAAVNRVLSGA